MCAFQTFWTNLITIISSGRVESQTLGHKAQGHLTQGLSEGLLKEDISLVSSESRAWLPPTCHQCLEVI